MDAISEASANKTTLINEALAALEPASLFGMRTLTTNLLTFGYYGGNISVTGAITTVADGTVALTASTTNYVEATLSGVVSKNTVGFTAGSIPLYQIVTDATQITAITDKRVLGAFVPQGTYSTPFMGALVNLSADLTSVNASAYPYIPAFNAETYDTHGFHDNVTNNSRITIPSGLGITKVRISANIRFDALGTAGALSIFIAKNGTTTNAGQPQQTLATATTFAHGSICVTSAVLNVADGDYFQVYTEYDSDTSLTLLAAHTWFAIEVVESAKATQHKDVFSTLSIVSNTLDIPLTGGGEHSVTLNANVTTVTLSGVTSGLVNKFTLLVKQDATGGRTWANPASWKFPGGTAYTVSSAANAVDKLTGRTYDNGTTWLVEYNKGYA